MSTPALLRIEEKLVSIDELLDVYELNRGEIDRQFVVHAGLFSFDSDIELYNDIKEAA